MRSVFAPHQYVRIVRFQNAVRLIKANRFLRLSDLAYDRNYVDQSDFIKDMKAFSGYTPTDLAKTVQAGIRLPCALILPRTHGPSTDSGDILDRATPALSWSRIARRPSRVGDSPVVPTASCCAESMKAAYAES